MKISSNKHLHRCHLRSKFNNSQRCVDSYFGTPEKHSESDSREPS